MKTNQPIVRFVMKHNRQQKDGSYPIYCVISHKGRVERATGISLIEKDWDEKKELAKKSAQNYLHINKELLSLKNDINSKIIDYQLRGIEYSLKDLFDERPIVQPMLSDVLCDMIDKRQLDHYTVKAYWYAVGCMEEYCDNRTVMLSMLTPEHMRSFGRWLKTEKGLANSTICHIMGKLCAICNHAKALNMMHDNPFDKYKYNRLFKKETRLYYLSEEEMRAIAAYYHRIKDHDLKYRLSDAFAVAFFLSMYKFNGSAPIDVAFIKAADIEIRTIKDNQYYCIDFLRHKTNMPVKCRIKVDELTQSIIGSFIEDADERDGFLYPVLQNNYRNMSQDVPYNKLKERLNSHMKKLTLILRRVLHTVNEEYGVSIDVEKVTMYSARHTLANLYLQQPKASVHGLASIMARNPNTIGIYVHQMRNDEEMVEAMSDMPV